MLLMFSGYDSWDLIVSLWHRFTEMQLCCFILLIPSLFAPPSIQPCKINQLSSGYAEKLAFKESWLVFVALLISNKIQAVVSIVCDRLFVQGEWA